MIALDATVRSAHRYALRIPEINKCITRRWMGEMQYQTSSRTGRGLMLPFETGLSEIPDVDLPVRTSASLVRCAS